MRQPIPRTLREFVDDENDRSVLTAYLAKLAELDSVVVGLSGGDDEGGIESVSFPVNASPPSYAERDALMSVAEAVLEAFDASFGTGGECCAAVCFAGNGDVTVKALSDQNGVYLNQSFVFTDVPRKKQAPLP
jgi:hypothetical protein